MVAMKTPLTFEQLEKMESHELVEIKEKILDEIDEARAEKYRLIGQILFYQKLLQEIDV